MYYYSLFDALIVCCSYSQFDTLSNLDPSKRVHRGSEKRNILDSMNRIVTIIGAGGAGCSS